MGADHKMTLMIPRRCGTSYKELNERIESHSASVAQFKEDRLREIVARLSGLSDLDDQMKWVMQHNVKLLVHNVMFTRRVEAVSIDGVYCGQFEFGPDMSVSFFPHGHLDPEIAQYL